jgi:isoleucyl-tRNA synthetase
LINRVQNLRKDKGLEVTDRILLRIETTDPIKEAIEQNSTYVCAEVLANSIEYVKSEKFDLLTEIEDTDDTRITIVS